MDTLLPKGDHAGASRREQIAVVGSGVAGLTAAYLLSRSHDVTLYEADDRLGGHAHTHDLPSMSAALGMRGGAHPDLGHTVPVDTGFIVHNDRTYPLLRKLFAELDVAVRPTEMSMSIRDDGADIEYAGGRGLRGFVARPRQLANRDYLTMLRSVRRFHQVARDFLDRTDDDDTTTYGELVRDAGLPEPFIRLYAVPLVACVWSTGGADALDYPARYLLRFLENHGMLTVGDSPQWYTVEGGSRTYVDKIASRVADIRRGSPVVALSRSDHGIEIRDGAGATQVFDRAVVATHPDQALALLADATPQEKTVLGAFRYSPNEAVLHRDPSLMPHTPAVRSSWNYLVDHNPHNPSPPVVTYWMNRLQGLPATHPAYVTLNARDRIADHHVVATMSYAHPLYDLAAVRAQRELPALNTDRLAFAGAYHGWGFHEDGARSGVAAAAALGEAW